MARPRKAAAPRGVGKRAVVYVRVSTEEQAREGNGIEAQRDACADYVLRMAYTTVGVFTDEGVSGTAGLKQREGLRGAIRLCMSRQADVLVCYAQDRLARKVGLFDQLREQLIIAGVRFETVKEAQDFTRTESFLMGDIYAAFAAEERRRIAGRLYGGRRVRSKRDGRGSAPVPFGYRVEQGAVVVDESAAVVVRRLLELRALGVTYQATAETLERERFSTPRGGKWTTGHVQSIERHKELYSSGRRVWDGVEAERPWPRLIEMSEQ